MKKTAFEGYNIYSTIVGDKNIIIDQILQEFHQNTANYQYTHYIKDRWENIYLSPQYIPSILPVLSYAISKALELHRNSLEPHQILIIPHDLLGYEKNEFWFNTACKGQLTGIHNHIKEAVVSGVFYLKVPQNSANLFFKSGEGNELEVESKTGKMIFFPSELDHYVPENKSQDMRISLSFNCYKIPLSASALYGLPL